MRKMEDEVRVFLAFLLRISPWRRENGAEYAPLPRRHLGVFGTLAILMNPEVLQDLDPEYRYEIRRGLVCRKRV